jgi:hypothetical protein
VAASQLKDARVVFLSLAFLGIAGIFATHGLTTPGALVPGVNPWVGFSARFAMFVGALFLAFSTVGWGSALERWIIRRQRALTLVFSAFLIGFITLALVTSFHEHPAQVTTATTSASSRSYGGYDDADAITTTTPAATGPLTGPFDALNSRLLGDAATAVTLALLGLVIFRYLTLHRLLRSPLTAGFLASAIFIAQAQVVMVTAPLWHASWWEYHVLLFASFCSALGGMALEYGRSGNLQGVVEGLLLRDSIAQLQRGYTEVIVALVRAVEAKDVYTRGHTQRVSDLAMRVGQELRLPREELRILARSAMLHDIGKIGVPDSILNKPGALTAEEFEVIKEHPARGHAIIKDVRSLQSEVGGVRHHHERWDGSGYPDGLQGEAIPLEARIIAVADVFDALTSPRPYRGAWSRQRALNLIREQSGVQFDPQCVAALERALTWQTQAAPLDDAPEGGLALVAS